MKSYLFGKYPHDILRQDFFDDAIDTIVLDNGFEEFIKFLATINGNPVK